MHPVNASTSSGSVAGNIADPQLVAPELAIRLHVHDPVRAQRGRHRGGVDASSKSIVPTTSERFAGSATNGVASACASAHAYRMR